MPDADLESKAQDAKRGLLEAETLMRQGRFADARTLLEDAVKQFEQLCDQAGQGRALIGLADVARQIGTTTGEDAFDAFYRLAEQARPLLEAGGDKAGLAKCLRYVCILQPPDVKRQMAVQSLALCKEIDDKVGVAESLRLISQLPDTENPEQLRNQAIEILRSAKADSNLATHLFGAAVASSAKDDYELALRQAGEARMLFRKTGNRAGEMRSLFILAHVAEQLGTEQAPDFLQEALELARTTNDLDAQASCYFNLIRLASLREDVSEAARLEAEATHLKGRLTELAKK